jgi:hypothetical protein
MVRTIKLLLTLGCLSLSAMAHGAPDPLEVCFQEADPNLRLACFDQEMQRRHGIADNPASEKHADDGVDPVRSQERTKLGEQANQPTAAGPLVATITRLVPRSGHLYYFELDNGQVWGQTESKADLLVRPHEGVTISPGALGGFFLMTQGRQSIRVYRVR